MAYTVTYETLPDGGTAFTIHTEDGTPHVYQSHNPYTESGFPKMDGATAEIIANRLISDIELAKINIESENDIE